MAKKNVREQLKLRSGSNKEKISRNEIESFKPTHMKFNFSFMTTNNAFSFENSDFLPVHQAQLLKRVYELSQEDYVVISGRNKKIGLEFIEKSSFNRPVEYSKKFDESDFRKKANDKFAVFRLYTNNNPIPARIIGKIVNKIFYIMFIDLSHDIYDG
jgi:hypothetical protein